MRLEWHGGRLKIESDKKKYSRWFLFGSIIGISIIFWILVFMFLFQKSSLKEPSIQDIIIEKIEHYKIANGYFPDSLDKVGIQVEGVSYQYIGPDRYILDTFDVFFHSRYHSASGEWAEAGSPKDEINSANDEQYRKLLFNSVNSMR